MEQILDDFRSAQLDPAKWIVAAFPLGDGNFWRWEEPKAQVETGNGRLKLTVNPYTKSHDQVQIFDNPKHLLLATQPFPVPQKGKISISCQMAAETINGNPDDFADGFATFNVLDFATGIVFDFIATSTKIGVVYERLLMPGLTTAQDAFTEIVEVGKNSPNQLFTCRVDYYPEGRVEFVLNGKVVLTRNNLPAKPTNFNIALGLITLRPIANEKSVSCHGQGGSGVWGPIEVKAT